LFGDGAEFAGEGGELCLFLTLYPPTAVRSPREKVPSSGPYFDELRDASQAA
jgi:hypothetical protein